MLIYYFINILLLLKNKQKKIIIFLLMFLLTIISSFRVYDADYSYYKSIYQNSSIHLEIPILYRVICSFFYKLGFTYRWYLFIMNIFISGLLYKIFKKITFRVDICLFLYSSYFFYILQMTQYRNLLAIIIFLYSFLCLKNNLLKLILLTASLLIHPSVVVLLFLYLYKFEKIYNKKVIYIIYFLSLSMIYLKVFDYFLIKLIQFDLNYISEKLKIYHSMSNNNIKINSVEIVYGIIFLFITNKIDFFKTNILRKKVYISFFLGVLSMILLKNYKPFYERIPQMYLILGLTIPGIFLDDKVCSNKFKINFLVSFLVIYNLLLIFYTGREIFLPYIINFKIIYFLVSGII